MHLAQQGPRLTTLPPELFRRIIHFIDSSPPRIIDLALTCKALVHQTDYLLERHRNAHKRYAVSSDLDPSTVPTLLLSALGFGDPVLIWHVRTFEVWGTRSFPKEWLPFTPDAETFIAATGEPRPWTFSAAEHEAMAAQAEVHFFQGAAARFTMDLDAGGDSTIKALLILLCPRLTNLKFAHKDERPTTCLDWLGLGLQRSSSLFGPGLRSLESIAINVDIGYSTSAEDGAKCPFHLFADLLRLPALTSIYAADLRSALGNTYEYDRVSEADDFERLENLQDEAALDILESECSAVQHIYLDAPHGFNINGDQMRALAAAPRALESISLCGAHASAINANDGSFVEAVSHSQFDSLQSVMIYRHRHQEIDGHGQRAFYPSLLDALYQADVLLRMAVHCEDLTLEAANVDFGDENGAEADAAVFRILYAWPTSVETMIVFGENAKESALRAIERGFIELIRKGDYENLKDLYLYQLEERQNVVVEPKFRFTEIIEVGKAAGVNVHTMSNRGHMGHRSRFPIGVDKFDMESGPWFTPDRWNDDKWEADIYDGVFRRRERSTTEVAG
ncbi:hypothetical protein ACHAQH_009611 [Verticillium albo-atrum]